MKAILLLMLLALGAEAQTNTVTVYFKWNYDPNQLGGLSPSDYLTNITFRVYSSTSVGTPMDQWTVLTNIPCSSLLVQGNPGIVWQVPIITDANTRFYTMKAVSSKAQGGGESPFSNTDFLLAPLPSGVLDHLH